MVISMTRQKRYRLRHYCSCGSNFVCKKSRKKHRDLGHTIVKRVKIPWGEIV